MIDDVYGICEKSDSVLVEGQELAPWGDPGSVSAGNA